jgi:predicted protein tyrosine phosphatase
MAGQFPGSPDADRARRKVELLVAAGVRTFIDLTDPREGLDPYDGIVRDVAAEQGLDLRHHAFTVRDMGIPTRERMTRILATVRTELEEHRTIYVHCWGGIGRTGTVIGCWLVEQGLAPAAALERIATLRQGLPTAATRSPETDEQCAFVHAWLDHGSG